MMIYDHSSPKPFFYAYNIYIVNKYIHKSYTDYIIYIYMIYHIGLRKPIMFSLYPHST